MRTLVAALLLTSLAGPALAADAGAAVKETEQAIKGKGRYGDAGCGLGSLAFGNDPGFIQVVASWLNVTLLYNQTFAISFGTSNCRGIAGVSAARAFVDTNREVLAKDIARGHGETIGALTWIGGCADSRAVGQLLQRSYPEIFPAADVPSDRVADAIVERMKADASLRCTEFGS
jgi:hypothetical protein